MAADSIKDISLTSDDDCSEDDEKSLSGRRRRFCIERKQDSTPSSSKSTKKLRLDKPETHPTYPIRDRFNEGRINGRRRKSIQYPYSRQSFSNYPHRHQQSQQPIKRQGLSHIEAPPKLKPVLPKEKPEKGPVIFINPKFVKKFIEKSLKLASSTSTSAKCSSTNKNSPASEGLNPPTPTTSVAIPMIDEIDFKTSSKECLQAASTMAVIRLVTECIEDDSKREEKLNKILISRLIDELDQHGRSSQESLDTISQQEMVATDTSTKPLPHQHHSYYQQHDTSAGYNSKISDEDDDSIESSGQPIPVIGGSVNHHFNKNASSLGYGPPKHRTQNTYQRPKRTTSDRSGSRDLELDANKLKNYS